MRVPVAEGDTCPRERQRERRYKNGCLVKQGFRASRGLREVFCRRLECKPDPDKRVNPIETRRGRGYRFRQRINLQC